VRTRTWRAAGIAALSALAVAAVAASRTDQSFYSDQALQMKTVVQFLAGESSRPNDWTRPDYADLSRDADEDLIVWAPGTPLAFLPFVRAGLSPARSARAVAVLALAAGSAGWACWFARFDLPDTWLFAFALVLPWMRFASNALFLYTSEILAFAIVPWILVGALAVERLKRGAIAGAAALGLAAGALYIVKYSATFVTAGVIVWFAWRTWKSEVGSQKSEARRQEGTWKSEVRSRKSEVTPQEGAWTSDFELRTSNFELQTSNFRLRTSDFLHALLNRRIGQLIAVTVGAAVPIVVLSLLNHQHGGAANLVLATLAHRWRWDHILHVLALPALAAADLNSLLMFVLMNPDHGITRNVFWLSLAGLPGGVLLAVLAARARARSPAAELARVVFALSAAAILVVWTMTTAVSIESRHLASAGFAMLPLALAEGRTWWREAGGPVRTLLGATACVFVLAPLTYGVVSVFAKTWRYPAAYRPAPSGIYNPLLSQLDPASAALALARDFDPSTDIWYLVDPLTALDLPGRAVVRHADFIELALLRRDLFLTSHRMRVHVLLPPRFETSGKGAAIRASFPQATAWLRTEIPAAEYVSWTAMLEPGDGQ